MIDKKIDELSKEELLNELNSKKELDSYNLLNLVYEENKKSNKYYSYFDDFLKMIYGKTSFTRMRGIGLCISLAKWDKDNKIDKALPELLNLLKDEKPTTVRISLSFFKDLLNYKPYLKNEILKGLDLIDLSNYKDSMSPLIKKDIEELKKLM